MRLADAICLRMCKHQKQAMAMASAMPCLCVQSSYRDIPYLLNRYMICLPKHFL